MGYSYALRNAKGHWDIIRDGRVVARNCDYAEAVRHLNLSF